MTGGRLGTLLFDGHGASIPPGGPPLDTINLRERPGCRMICEGWPAEIGCIVMLQDDSALDSDVLGRLVRVLEDGEAVVIHARGDEIALRAVAEVMLWLGGGNA